MPFLWYRWLSRECTSCDNNYSTSSTSVRGMSSALRQLFISSLSDLHQLFISSFFPTTFPKMFVIILTMMKMTKQTWQNIPILGIIIVQVRSGPKSLGRGQLSPFWAISKRKFFLGKASLGRAKNQFMFCFSGDVGNIAPPHKMLAIFLNIPIQQHTKTSSCSFEKK